MVKRRLIPLARVRAVLGCYKLYIAVGTVFFAFRLFLVVMPSLVLCLSAE